MSFADKIQPSKIDITTVADASGIERAEPYQEIDVVRRETVALYSALLAQRTLEGGNGGMQSSAFVRRADKGLRDALSTLYEKQGIQNTEERERKIITASGEVFHKVKALADGVNLSAEKVAEVG